MNYDAWSYFVYEQKYVFDYEEKIQVGTDYSVWSRLNLDIEMFENPDKIFSKYKKDYLKEIDRIAEFLWDMKDENEIIRAKYRKKKWFKSYFEYLNIENQSDLLSAIYEFSGRENNVLLLEKNSELSKFVFIDDHENISIYIKKNDLSGLESYIKSLGIRHKIQEYYEGYDSENSPL